MTYPLNDLQAAGIFTEALELPSEDRSRFLDCACYRNPDLRAKVEAPLEANPKAESLFRDLVAATDAVVGRVTTKEPVATEVVSDQMTEAPRIEASATRIIRKKILEKLRVGDSRQ